MAKIAAVPMTKGEKRSLIYVLLVQVRSRQAIRTRCTNRERGDGSTLEQFVSEHSRRVATLISESPGAASRERSFSLALSRLLTGSTAGRGFARAEPARARVVTNARLEALLTSAGVNVLSPPIAWRKKRRFVSQRRHARAGISCWKR